MTDELQTSLARALVRGLDDDVSELDTLPDTTEATAMAAWPSARRRMAEAIAEELPAGELSPVVDVLARFARSAIRPRDVQEAYVELATAKLESRAFQRVMWRWMASREDDEVPPWLE